MIALVLSTKQPSYNAQKSNPVHPVSKRKATERSFKFGKQVSHDKTNWSCYSEVKGQAQNAT